MKFEIKHRLSGEVLFEAEAESLKDAAELAVKGEANLGEADLRGADLRGANLREANLRETYFRGANLREANLREANLGGADLRGANLEGANLDFSSGLTFSCASFGFKADLRLAAQLAYHFCKINFDGCELAEKAQKDLRDLANQFHRIGDDVCKII